MQPRRPLLAIMLFSSLAFAAGTDLTLLVPGVAAVVIVMLAAVNMLATAVSNPQAEAWAKTEMREFLAGVILIVLVIMFLFGAQGVAAVITQDPDYIEDAQARVDGWVEDLLKAYHDVIETAGRIRAGASYSSGTNIPLWYVSLSYQTSPLGGVALFLVPLSLSTQGLSNAIYLAEAIRFLLAFFQVVIPKVLLPLSFSLRLIPFTRRLGNTLIALSVAAIVFFPASVFFADYLNGQIDAPVPAVSDMGKLDANPFPIFVFGPICEAQVMRILFSMTDPLFSLIVCLPLAFIPGYFSPCFDTMWHVVYPIMSLVFQALNAILLIAWEAAVRPDNYGEDVYNQLQPFLRDVSNYVMVIYLDVVFIGIVTIAGARSLSSALGGEWYMAGVQRLI